MGTPPFETIYRDVPTDLLGPLREFRAAHPYQRAAIGGVNWPYIAAGQGPTTLVVLTGIIGTGESMWQVIAPLAESYRVLAPSYPPVLNTMADLAKGITGIMDKEGVEKAHLLGESYGGFLGQVFVRRCADRVDKLIISHAGPPTAERGKTMAGRLRWLRLMPMGLVRSMFKRRLGRLMPMEHPEAPLFYAYFGEVADYHLTREGFINGNRGVVDFDSNYAFTPHDLADWPGAMLLMMADNDPTTPDPMREVMRALYPTAEFHLFSGSGHGAQFLKRDEYLSVVKTFLG